MIQINGKDNYSSVEEMDTRVGVASCRQILAPSLLNYVPISKLGYTIDVLISKLRHGGELILGGYNLNTIIGGFNSGLLTQEQLINMLYGDYSSEYHMYSATYDMNYVIEKMKNKLDITSKKIICFEFIIHSHRR